MKRMLIAGGAALALASPAALAQNAPATCYVQLGRLMADPPNGVGEFSAAIHQLEVALRPQVEEINLLKAELERLQQRQHEALQNAEEDGPNLAELQDQVQRLAVDLDAKQGQLKRDYEAERQALIMPVQARVNARAQVFASQHGCGEMKMARLPDLAGLQATAARDVTGEFVTWYVQGRS